MQSSMTWPHQFTPSCGSQRFDRCYMRVGDNLIAEVCQCDRSTAAVTTNVHKHFILFYPSFLQYFCLLSNCSLKMLLRNNHSITCQFLTVVQLFR